MSFLSSSFLPVLLLLLAVVLLSRSPRPAPPDLSSYPWLYFRDGEPLGSGEETVELVAVGDVMLGRGVTAESQVFQGVARWLRGADVTMGNLECVVTGESRGASTWSAGSEEAVEMPVLLRAPPRAVAQLRGAGFDLLGLANNHALDLGSAGLSETVYRLQAAGITALGAGPDAEAAFRPFILEVSGLRLAFLAFNAVPDGRGWDEGWARADWDPERALAAVETARGQADAVVVSVHWGYEYQLCADPLQRDTAERLLQAGADLVVGHHPHVVQAVQTGGDRCVAYSLGNFVFDQGQGETGKGLALRAFFDGQGLRAVQALPLWAGARPRLMTPDEAEVAALKTITDGRVGMGQRASFRCDEGTCYRVDGTDGYLRGPWSGLFWGGRVDLSGDGIAEHVRRVDEQVIVYSEGAEVWRSPRAWRVVDVALGDPNDDGRGEMLLALWKPGLDGLETPSPEKERMLRSHPFITGYRGGVYRTLWGGSTVNDPIHEVELGDVDGDRAHELIVLEGDDPDERTLSVWRWHGWGFSLLWRSAPSAYYDLMLDDDGTIWVATD